jgi:transglutaminase-like putative cysteine protease
MSSDHKSIPFEPKSVDNYRKVSIQLAYPQTLKQLSELFDRRYSLKELLEWIHARLKFNKGNIERHSDPLEILAYGQGRCSEFSVLFTALCLAHNYRARLIMDMSDHVWTEVWNSQQKRWVHVDPSEKRIDDPMMYERDWKKDLKEIYALENGQVENVTANYKLHSTR